jgi:hypothetical protein
MKLLTHHIMHKYQQTTLVNEIKVNNGFVVFLAIYTDDIYPLI